MKICVFGGTFDPWTISHQQIIDKLYELDEFSFIHVVPTIVNYHRNGKKPWLSDFQKTECIRAALYKHGYSVSGFSPYCSNTPYGKDGCATRILIDDRELRFREMLLESQNSTGVANELISGRRFIDTLLGIKVSYPKTTEVYTAIGSDSAEKLRSWYHYDDIINNTKIIVVGGRSGTNVPSDIPIDRTITLGDAFSDVSASRVREVFAEHDDGFEMLLDYILEKY